jgi:predicted transcriptional regulator
MLLDTSINTYTIKGKEMNQKNYNKDQKECIKKLILETLESAPVIRGATVNEIAANTGLPRSTAHIYLSILEAQGLINHVRLGKNKIYHLKSQ